MMPQNQMRLWAGLAIVAIAIPAAVTYYTRSTTGVTPASSITVAHRTSVVGLGHPEYNSRMMQVAGTSQRDYLAEVRRATGDDAPASTTDNGATDWDALNDEMFDISPMDDTADTTPETTRDLPPDPGAAVAPDAPATVAYSTDGPVQDDTLPLDDDGQPALTDAAVYRIVMNNLNDDDREEFVRAYTAMTPAPSLQRPSRNAPGAFEP